MKYNLVHGVSMTRKKTGARLQLGEPLATDLTAFCEALLGTPEIRVVREAVRVYIDQRLVAEPELRRRYDAARKRMMGAGDNVVIMPKGSQ